MSGIFGTYHRDKQPANRELWERLGNITAHRGPDGTVIQSSGSVLLGHNALHTTTESLQERLPYFSSTSGLAITADARIDNRTELLHLLDIQETAGLPIPDSKIILAAFEKWGEESFKRLIGDFSFVIWDSKENKIFCVRDIIGVKPFYYLLSDRLFAFSSELKPLLMHPDASRSVNEGMVGEHLAANLISKTETLFNDISRLAPAHYMTISPETSHIQCYWKPNFHHRLRYQKETEYIEHFQDIFSESISCRLRSHLPISFELSGGLDSSSIVGLAHALPSVANTDDFSICSLIYPGLACDESKYSKSVVEHLGTKLKQFDAIQTCGPDWQRQVHMTATLPAPPNLSNSEVLLEYVQQKNSRVLLTGIGGDEWLCGSDYTYLDLLIENDYAGIIQELKNNFRQNKKKAIKKLTANLVWPFLPFSARLAIIKKRRGQSLYPPWISDAFAKKINLDERIFSGFSEPYVSNLAHADIFGLFHSGYESNALEKNDCQKARFHVEGRHPFLDRRLIEFAIAIPNSLHQQNGIKKHLLRLAGKNYLPTIIRNRYCKAEFSQLYHQTFSTRSFANTVKNSGTYANGWINKQTLQNEYENNLHCFQKTPSGPCPKTLQIWFAFAISIWYENL